MTHQTQVQKALFDNWLEKETKRIKDGVHQTIDSGGEVTFDSREYSTSEYFDISEFHFDWTIKHVGRKAVEEIAKITSKEARSAKWPLSY